MIDGGAKNISTTSLWPHYSDINRVENLDYERKYVYIPRLDFTIGIVIIQSFGIAKCKELIVILKGLALCSRYFQTVR